MKHIMPFLTVVILAGAFLATIFVQTTSLLSIKASEARSAAVDGCLNASSYTYSKDGVTTVEPIEKAVTKCLELKNIK